jgi:hypothetical protein
MNVAETIAAAVECEPVSLEALIRDVELQMDGRHTLYAMAREKYGDLLRDLDDPRTVGRDRDDIITELGRFQKNLQWHPERTRRDLDTRDGYVVIARAAGSDAVPLVAMGNLHAHRPLRAVLAGRAQEDAAALILEMAEEITRQALIATMLRQGYLPFPEDQAALGSLRRKYGFPV